jgi:predicted HAD superfamily Cof-like phosphohydrolase
MTKLQRQVLEFHKVFDHPVAGSPIIPSAARVRFRAAFIVEECLEFLEACFDASSVAIPAGNQDVTAGMLLNSARENLKALIAESRIAVDLPLAVDALADIDYVVEGTRLEFGVNGEPIADEVHRANMTKAHSCPACDGDGFVQKNDHDSDTCPRCLGKKYVVVKRANGKTLKPEGWKPPNIAGKLEEQRPRGPQMSPDSLESIIADPLGLGLSNLKNISERMRASLTDKERAILDKRMPPK